MQTRSRIRWIAAAFLLALCAALLITHHRRSQTHAEVDPNFFTGKPAPDFALQDLHGKTVRLGDLRGKAVLLNFWATWCGPCKLESPWLSELHDKYAPHGLEVLGVSTEGEDLKPGDKAGQAHQLAAIRDFVQLTQPSYPILLNGDSISRLYGGVNTLPASFYINKNGTIVAAQIGLHSESEIEASIQKALGQ